MIFVKHVCNYIFILVSIVRFLEDQIYNLNKDHLGKAHVKTLEFDPHDEKSKICNTQLRACARLKRDQFFQSIYSQMNNSNKFFITERSQGRRKTKFWYEKLIPLISL